MKNPFFNGIIGCLVCLGATLLAVQASENAAGRDQPPDFTGGPGFDGPPPMGPGNFGPGGPPGGFGGPGGPGGFGPGMGRDMELVKQFDKDSSGWLNTEERKAAREFLEKQGTNRRMGGPGGPGGPGGRRGPFGGGNTSQEPPKAGEKVTLANAKAWPGEPLYASNVLRTLFLEFESADWEKELEVFHGTDVEVPATLVVDGKTCRDVGVRFRGNTSYMMVGTGWKRPLNISVDLVHEDQRLLGHRTLNLLNAHEDSSFLRTVLAMQIARDYFPAPQANFVRLVINGEGWGVYVNVEQFNKDFLTEWVGTTKGARWKVPGNPGGRGGLGYLGDDVAAYKQVYEIKSKDEPKAWASLIRLCKVLNETPAPSRLAR